MEITERKDYSTQTVHDNTYCYEEQNKDTQRIKSRWKPFHMKQTFFIFFRSRYSLTKAKTSDVFPFGTFYEEQNKTTQRTKTRWKPFFF